MAKETFESVKKRFDKLNITEDDPVEKFVLGSGSGGQKINKTSSCVYLKHIPTGIEIKCQRERSRELNRYYARKELCDRIEEKIKEKMLAAKKHVSEKKSLRQNLKDFD